MKKKYNAQQKEAIEHDDGTALIVAGAGTGKTTVLIGRLQHLIEKKLAGTDEILLLTFTEKAAGEMYDRAVEILPYGYVDLWINTFHGFCERLLREHALDIGLDPSFKLVNDTEQWILIKKNLDKFNLDYYRPLGNPNKFIFELVKHFSRLKDEYIEPKEYLQFVENLIQGGDQMLSGRQITSHRSIKLKVESKNVILNEAKRNEESREVKVKDNSTGSFSAQLADQDDMSSQELSRLEELANAYHAYNKLLLDNGYLDFGDLINYCIKLFQERPNILKYYQEKFKYIMVDEFQDTNWSQYELLKQLVKSHPPEADQSKNNKELLIEKSIKSKVNKKKIENRKSKIENSNLMVVGDDDQAIYKFRGASLSNIMQFKEDYPDAKEIVLMKNYRSGQNILDKAYNFIKHNNPNRLEVKLNIDKQIKSQIKEKGSVEHMVFSQKSEESVWVAEQIMNMRENNPELKWSDFAILVRANNTAQEFVDELKRKNIPCLFYSMRGLYYKPIIMDVLAYFKLLDNYHESSALFRVLNMEAFKVGHADIININKFARKKVWSLFEALQHINAIPDVSAEAVSNINKLLDLIRKHSLSAQNQKPSQVFAKFVWDAELNKKDFDAEQEYYSYLNQFYKKVKSFEENEADARVKDFMEYMEMELESGETGALRLDFEDDDVVRVMTVHGSKGLEFDTIFLVDLVDKRFPTVNRSEKISIPDELVREKLPEEGDAHIEEERRLFYVALTRAKNNLFLTSARDYGGARDKKPSPFISEALLNSPLEGSTPEGGGVLRSPKEKTLNRDSDDNTLPATADPSRKGNHKNKYELMRDLELINQPVVKKECTYKIPKNFSFSQIEAFSNCPLQYKFNFILKIPVLTKDAFIYGRVMHNTLKDFLAPLESTASIQPDLFASVENKNVILNEAKRNEESRESRNGDGILRCAQNDNYKNKLAQKNLKEAYEKHWQNDGYESKETREKYKKKGWRELKMFYEYLEKEGWPEVLFLEKVFSFKLGDYFFRGAIDRVDRLPDGSVEVMDYKTGNAKEKLTYQQKRQLILYKIVLEEAFGLKVSKLSFYYLENGTKASFKSTVKQEEKLKEEINEVIEEIKKCEFLPKPSMLCSFCDFNSICEFRQ